MKSFREAGSLASAILFNSCLTASAALLKASALPAFHCLPHVSEWAWMISIGSVVNLLGRPSTWSMVASPCGVRSTSSFASSPGFIAISLWSVKCTAALFRRSAFSRPLSSLKWMAADPLPSLPSSILLIWPQLPKICSMHGFVTSVGSPLTSKSLRIVAVGFLSFFAYLCSQPSPSLRLICTCCWKSFLLACLARVSQALHIFVASPAHSSNLPWSW